MLACLSRRRSRVQIPSRTLAARYANRLSGEAQIFVFAGSTPACATDRVMLAAAGVDQLSETQAESDDEQVQFLPNPITARSSIG